MENRNRQVLLRQRPAGVPTPADFEIAEAPLPEPREGEVLVSGIFLSLDPYMRGRISGQRSYARPVEVGAVMEGRVVGKVAHSRDPNFREGDYVLGGFGWQLYSAVPASALLRLDPVEAPLSTALGVLGMPGFTAYSGLRFVGMPKPGETVVVAAASGPVGSLVGQLAKIGGTRAVAIAGGSRKCSFVKEELKFDAAVDHRSIDFPAQLAAACPNGIDVYFENVGGMVWQTVLPLLNNFARVPVCGLVAQYNGVGAGDGIDRLPVTMHEILFKSLTLRGFIYEEFVSQHYSEFLREVGALIADGRIRYREDVADGLERAPEAFIAVLDGRNFGKAIVRVSA